MTSRLRFRPKFRDQLLASKRANDMYADLAGMPRLDYGDRIKPVRTVVRNPDRISENQVNDTIREFSARRNDITLWRNNRGEVMTASGAIIRYGVGPNGASDWIGYRQIVITQEMVGAVIAQFVAVEAKAPDADAPTSLQQRFLEHINKIGGIAIEVRERKDLDRL